MGRSNEYTNIGGANLQFPPTEWTRIIGFSLGESIQNEFVGRYWKPVYGFLRHKGYNNEEAKDLTQGFFTEIILDSNLFKGIDRSRGKFRTLLITALNHYVIDVIRHEKRIKRHPGTVRALDENFQLPDHSLASPEEAFDYEWAAEILGRVLTELKTQCLASGLATHWEVFNARVLQPILSDAEAPPLTEVCRALNISSAVKASNMIVTVKRHFRQLLKGLMQKFSDSDTDVEQEIIHLTGIFGRGTA